MARLTTEYGIEEDSRYALCVREAVLSAVLFLLAAVAGLGSIYGLTVGRDPEMYGAVLGLPSYLFWGIIITVFTFLLALLVSLRWVFQEVNLDPIDPSIREGVTDG
jgi:hypothetical protein